MMEVVSKDMIEACILPYLSSGQRGPEPSVCLCDIVRAILYRLKTSCQWRMLPLGAFFPTGSITWNGVYYYHNKWVEDGSWTKAWIGMLKENKELLDLSSMQLDGSHTPAKKQGEGIGYQGRKSARTTNALFLSDNSGQPLVVGPPQEGNHNDLYKIEALFEQMCALLEQAGIDLRGVFMNADAGFDGVSFRDQCDKKEIEANIATNERGKKQPREEYRYFDTELYKRRFVGEQVNAWLDGFKTILVRYEGKLKTWVADHLMAFIVLFINRKLLPLLKH